MQRSRAWVVILFATLALAGCTDEVPAPTDDVEATTDVFTDEAGRDLRTDLTVDDELPAPEWRVGDWFGHHVFFGSGDQQGTHINTVVVEDLGDQWMLATDDQDVAKWEAAWDFPMLGTFGKDTLDTTAFSADWGIYQFPMRDGLTWTSTINPLFSGARDVTFTATYNDGIKTPYGIRPGFDIVGVNSNDTIEIQTDYVPEIGWYNELTAFDTSTEEPDDFIIHVIAMGKGDGWSGTYWIDEATNVVNFGRYNTPFDPAGSTWGERQAFDMTDGSQRLYGIIGGWTSTATSRFAIIDPASTRYDYEVTDTSADSSFAAGTFLFEFLDIPSQAGAWEFLWGGAGGVSVGFATLFEISEVGYVM